MSHQSLISIEQAKEILNLTRQRIEQLISEGVFQTFQLKAYRKTFLLEEEVEAYAINHRKWTRRD